MTLHKVFVTIFTAGSQVVGKDKQTGLKKQASACKRKKQTLPPSFPSAFFKIQQSLFLLLFRINWQRGTGLFVISGRGKEVQPSRVYPFTEAICIKKQQNVKLLRFFSIVSFHWILNINSNSLQFHQPFCFSLKYLFAFTFPLTKKLFPSQICVY